MKPKISFFALADTVITDKQNKNSLIGIFQTFNVSSVPTVLASFAVFLRIIGVSKAKEIEIKVTNQSGEIVATQSYQNLQLKQDSINVATLFTNTKITTYGKYEVLVYVDKEKLDSGDEQFFTVIPKTNDTANF